MKRQSVITWLKVITSLGIYGGLLMPMVFLPSVIFPFVFSKLIALQILIGLTFPAYVGLAILEPSYRPRLKPVYFALLAFLTAIGISVIFAADPSRAWWGNQERMNGLFTVLHFFAWLVMATAVLKTWDQWKKLLGFQIVVSVLMAIVALLQLPFPKLLLFPAGPRVGGLLDNPIYMAGYQIFSFFFIALLWLKTKSNQVRASLAAALLIDFGAFLAAQSRGALLGLAVGVFVFGFMWVVLGKSKKAKYSAVAAMLVFFLSYGAIYAARDTQVIRNSPLARLTNLTQTTATRFIAWDIAWQGFIERPLTGWGFDNFHILFNLKYNPASLEYGYYETWFDRAHNTLMDTLSMTGLFGMLTYLGLWITLIYSVVTAYRKKYLDASFASVLIALPVAYFVQNLFVFDQPAGFTMSYLMFALIICATTGEFIGEKDPAAKTESKNSNSPTTALLSFGVLQILALIVVYRTSILPFKASQISIDSNNAFASGNLDQSFDLAQQAAAIPTPYRDEQTFLQSRNLISLAQSGQMATRFPRWREWHDLVQKITQEHLVDHLNNTHPHFIYANFLQAFSSFVPEDRALAEAEYIKAVATSPKRQQLLFSLGRFYLEDGRKQEALDQFQIAADADPQVGESLWYLGLTEMFDLGKTPEGSKNMIAAFSAKAPYILKDVREATALAIAYQVTGDKAGLLALIAKLPDMAPGIGANYIDISRAAEALGLIEQRNLILGAITHADPTLAARFAPLQNGSATSIDASLRLTANLASSTPAVVTSTAPVSSTPVATSSPAGSGPRAR